MKLKELAMVLPNTRKLVLEFYDGNVDGESTDTVTKSDYTSQSKLLRQYGDFTVHMIHGVSVKMIELTLRTADYGNNETPAAGTAGESENNK